MVTSDDAVLDVWVERIELVAAHEVNIQVHSSSLGMFVPLHHLDDFLTRDQFDLVTAQFVLDERNLVPVLSREFRVLQCDTG